MRGPVKDRVGSGLFLVVQFRAWDCIYKYRASKISGPRARVHVFPGSESTPESPTGRAELAGVQTAWASLVSGLKQSPPDPKPFRLSPNSTS